MPNYTIILSKKAGKQLDNLSDHIAEPILEAIASLELHPRPNGSKKLKNREAYRIRSGDYRIIYHIFEKKLIIDILALGHRKDIYK